MFSRAAQNRKSVFIVSFLLKSMIKPSPCTFFTHPLTHPLSNIPIHPHTHPSTRSPIHSLTYPSTYSSLQEHSDDDTDDVDSNPLGRLAPAWLPDNTVSMCQLCSIRFTVTRRRHHCRACGMVSKLVWDMFYLLMYLIMETVFWNVAL